MPEGRELLRVLLRRRDDVTAVDVATKRVQLHHGAVRLRYDKYADEGADVQARPSDSGADRATDCGADDSAR